MFLKQDTRYLYIKLYCLKTIVKDESIITLVNVYVDLLCKHLGIDSSTDLADRYSNLFLNAYINRHVHAKYLKMI